MRDVITIVVALAFAILLGAAFLAPELGPLIEDRVSRWRAVVDR